MQIFIKYFASLREHMGESSTVITVNEGISIDELWQSLSENKMENFHEIMMTVNKKYVKSDHILQENDEVGFFPPVTGG